MKPAVFCYKTSHFEPRGSVVRILLDWMASRPQRNDVVTVRQDCTENVELKGMIRTRKNRVFRSYGDLDYFADGIRSNYEKRGYQIFSSERLETDGPVWAFEVKKHDRPVRQPQSDSQVFQ
jgi:hypothetical protein